MDIDDLPSISNNRIKHGAVVTKYAIVDVGLLTQFISSIIRGCGSGPYLGEISVENAAGTLALGLHDAKGNITRTPLSRPVILSNNLEKNQF